MIRVVVAAVSAGYLVVAGALVLLYWTNATASWSSSAAGAVVNGVLQWFTLAGSWVMAALW